MSDDVCGALTANDTPCQNPTTDDGDSDRCWIDGHNESDVDAGQPGRDFAISPDDYDDILDAARDGMSLGGCARAAGVDRASLTRYLDAHPDFRADFERARAQGERELVRGALYHDEDAPRQMNGQHARFLLSTSFGYVKTEKREVEMDVDADVSHDTPAEFVTYGSEDDEQDGDE